MQKVREFPYLNVTTILDPLFVCVYIYIYTKISIDILLDRSFSYAASAPAVVEQVKSIEKVDNRRYEFNFALLD